jgi:zinc protease
MARRLTARSSPAWVGDLPVFERTLANGLKALVLPRARAPVVVCDLYYPVGSVNDPAGKTGLAHFVEHMLFKGTERFPKGYIDRLAFAAAGSANAETSEDCTHYWFAFPADRWELALAIEADRMRGAIFDPREVEAERFVIAAERAREVDSPLRRLDLNHLAVSYLVHPYRNPILGWPDDLARTTVEDLRRFYQAHYRPEGAVLIIVGALDPNRVLDRIETYFGTIPRGAARPRLAFPAEPRQNGRRDFTLLESEAVARGLFGWHSAPLGHLDNPALDVLSDVLSCGRRSRLWNRLVEQERLAIWVEASQEPSRLAGQFLIQVEAAPGVEPARIEATLRAILSDLANDGPTAEELVRSRHRLEAAWRWEQEDAAGLAAGLGQVALWDDWRAWQAEHRAAMAIEADDIRRVASTYLVENNLTAGWSLPRPGRGMTVLLPAEISPATPRPPAPSPETRLEPALAIALPQGASRLADYRPSRMVLRNGLRLLTERRPGTGVVALELDFDAGSLREAQPGLAYLTARMLEHGTTSRSADDLASAIEDVGGTLEIGSTGVSIRVRAEDLPLAVALLLDLARRPALPAEALAWAKQKIVAELRGDLDDPIHRAELAFRSLVYGDHPYGRDPRGTIRQVGRLRLDDVKAHHARLFVPENACLIVVGDFEPPALRALLRTHAKGWSASGLRLPAAPVPVQAVRPRARRIAHPGEQVHLWIGHLGVRRNHPDFDALVVLDHILGSGPGFNDRLSRILRDELGLAYSVGGGMTDSADVVPGLFRIYVGTGPDEAEHALAAVLEQVRAMHRGAFSDEEVEQARRYLAGSWVFDFQTVEQRAERLLELERWGLPLDEPLHWPDRLAQISPNHVRRAAHKHLNPAALARVEFGPLRPRRRRADRECA